MACGFSLPSLGFGRSRDFINTPFILFIVILQFLNLRGRVFSVVEITLDPPFPHRFTMSSITMEVGDYAYGGFKVIVVASLLILMQILMVGGRLVSRRLQNVWLGIDDYVLISATVNFPIILVAELRLIRRRSSQCHFVGLL